MLQLLSCRVCHYTCGLPFMAYLCNFVCVESDDRVSSFAFKQSRKYMPKLDEQHLNFYFLWKCKIHMMCSTGQIQKAVGDKVTIFSLNKRLDCRSLVFSGFSFPLCDNLHFFLSQSCWCNDVTLLHNFFILLKLITHQHILEILINDP